MTNVGSAADHTKPAVTSGHPAAPDRSTWHGGSKWSRPRWPAATGVALSATGFGVAGYLTFEHYTSSTSLSCPAGGGAVNCLKVTTSIYSMIHGAPVAVLGLIFFAVMAVLQSPAAWRSDRREIRATRLVWSAAGVATSLWLVYAELFKIDAICLWCSAVHVITLALFVTTLFGTVSTSRPPTEGSPPQTPARPERQPR
jgi:uncharacterized membrane protein